MREGLCHDIALKPFRGGRKIAIIDDADYLNQEGANCLLKTLEEPPEKSVIILIGTSQQRQLPTIRSRCQIVRFAPLSTAAGGGTAAGSQRPSSRRRSRRPHNEPAAVSARPWNWLTPNWRKRGLACWSS